MTPPPPHLDIVTLMIVLSSAVFGPDLAQAIGPYSVIILSAIGGAAWSATGIEQATRMRTLRHMATMVGLALIGAVPVAEILARVTDIEVRWTLGPVAAAIAARPDLVLGWLRRWFAKRTGDTEVQP
jgi:hypothetical protein